MLVITQKNTKYWSNTAGQAVRSVYKPHLLQNYLKNVLQIS